MYLVDGVLYGKVRTVPSKLMRRTLMKISFRKIGIYHGRPTSILRSDIDADLPGNTVTSESASFDFDATGLVESIQLTHQAEAFLHQM
jgi:hypothetical protein